MDRDLLAVLGFLALFALMALRVPIAFAMGIVGIGGFALIGNPTAALRLLAQSPLRTVADYNLSVIPMFVLMGAFATAGGMSRELFRAAEAWLGHRRGGLALSSIAACGLFAAINGSSVATAATMTTVALPQMRRAGYRPGAAAGVIAAGGTLGIMIPPSVIFAIYALLTQQDLVKLFMSGVMPGLLAIVMYAITVRILCWRDPTLMPRGPRRDWPERWAALRDVWATLALFLIVVVGMYGIQQPFGLPFDFSFTVTEGAGIGAFGALAIGVLRGRIDVAIGLAAAVEALRTSAAIFAIVVGAFLFGYFLTITQATQHITQFLVSLPVGPYGVLALILVGYLVLGAVMDELAMVLLTIPIVYPVMMQLGFDPIWFGVIVVMTVTLGMICPPVGINVFVINSIARDVSLGAIYRGVAPYIVCDLIRLAILCAFPAISLWLPGTMS